jgi:ABC-type uncharacterized transport system permease subunit
MPFLSAAVAALYLLAAVFLFLRLRKGAAGSQESRLTPLLIGLAAVAGHLALLVGSVFMPEALNLGFFNVVSLTAWLVAALLLVSALGQPVENLGIVILPLAGLAVIAQTATPANPTLISRSALGLEVHILLSIASYSLLTIAAVQALLLAVQDRHLRNRRPGGFIRALPPLETMESLLFRLIKVGFAFLSASLASGAMFVSDLFAQHLVHKTTLSIAAWAVFAMLLWGRFHFGWRGRTAIRWTIGGFLMLALAYFGSKLVQELILR